MNEARSLDPGAQSRMPGTTRREFLRRAAWLGLPAAAWLAACTSPPPAPTPAPTTAPAASPAAPPPGPASPVAASPVAAPTTGPSPVAVASPAVSPSPAASPAPAASPSPAASLAPTSGRRPKRGGTFVTLSHQDVTGLSPDDARQAGFRAVIANIHEGLLKVDENYQVQPALAQRYQASPDGRTWTFDLRQGVKWHDGQPFTAEDVKYNFDWVRDPANAAIGQPLFADVERVETPNPGTVVVQLSKPNAPFAALSATRLLVPKHVHEKIGEKAYRQQPMGTGPWKLKEFEPASHALLEANPDYWGGRPYIDFWRQNVVPEPSVRAVALRTGDADATTWPLTPEDILQFLKDDRFRTYRAPGAVINHFPISNRSPFFADVRVRQALLYAMDRDALVNDLMKGLAVKATANLSPALEFYYEPNVKQYPRDVARAKALLTEAGWKPGSDGILVNGAGQRFQINCIVFTGDALRRSEAEIVQRNFQEVGIEMRLREMEVAVGLDAGRKGDYEIGVWNTFYGGDGGDPDARDGLQSGALNNFPQWSNPEADRLLAAGVAEADPAKRKQIYGDLQKLVAEQVPFLYVMFWENDFQFSRRIKGMPEKATNPAWLLQEVHRYWIEEE